MESTMAKGQKKSTREAKKPKKTEAEKLKAKTPAGSVQSSISGKDNKAK
jgi:hypothetical protein